VSTDVSADHNSAASAVRSIGLTLIVASILGSTLGIVIAQFLDDLGDGLLGWILGSDNAVLYNNRVEFAGASDVAWAGGFLLCLIVGLIALFAYPTQRGQNLSRLTLLWVILHVLRQAFSQAMFLPFADDGQLGRAYATFEAAPGLDAVIAAAGGVGLALIALGAASAFLAFAPHRSKISTPRKRFLFALWIALVPAAISVFVAIPFFSPDAGSGVIPGLPLVAVMFLLTLAAAPGTTTVRGPEDERTYEWPIGLAGTLLVILLVEVILFRNGVSIDPTQWG
jgi:MFS family permease